MDEAAIPHAIELLVGLLGLAAFVAIVARPLRLPVHGGPGRRGADRRHRRRGGRIPAPRRVARHRPARPPARARLRGGLSPPLRRAPALVRRPRPAGRPRRPDLGGDRRAGPERRHRPSTRPRVHRRGDGLGDRPRRRRRDLQAVACPTGAVDAGRWREPPQRRHGPGPVRDRAAGRDDADRAGRGRRRVRGHRGDQRRDRPRHRVPCRPDHRARRRSSRRADDHGRAGVWQLHARGRLPPVRGDRHGHGRHRARQCRSRQGDDRDGCRRHRHRLGVLRLPADGRRLPARRARDPAGPPPRVARPDRLGDRRHPDRSRDRGLPAARWSVATGTPPGAGPNLSRAAGSTCCSGPVCAGRWPWRWRSPCRPTSRSGRCSRRSPSGSSCSRCSSRGRRSAGSSTGRSGLPRSDATAPRPAQRATGDGAG